MKLFVIVRNIHGEFWGGVLKGELKSYPGVVITDLIPNSLSFEVVKRIYKKDDIPQFEKFVSINEYRKKCNGRLPIKFSQVIMDNLGFDRVWVYRECKL